MDDLISRQAAIASAISGRVRTLPTSEDGEDWIRTSEVRESLLNLSSAEPEPRWIPVTERLPEEVGHYLCSFKEPLRIDGIHVDLAYWTGGQWYGYMADAITAWMPLPEPYRAEGRE